MAPQSCTFAGRSAFILFLLMALGNLATAVIDTRPGQPRQLILMQDMKAIEAQIMGVQMSGGQGGQARLSYLETRMLLGPTTSDPAVLIGPAISTPQGARLQVGLRAEFYSAADSNALLRPTTGVLGNSGLYRHVTELGSVAFTNEQLLDPGSIDGLLPRLMASVGPLDAYNNGPSDMLVRFLTQTFFRGADRLPGSAQNINIAFRRFRQDNKASYTLKIKNPALIVKSNGLTSMVNYNPVQQAPAPAQIEEIFDDTTDGSSGADGTAAEASGVFAADPGSAAPVNAPPDNVVYTQEQIDAANADPATDPSILGCDITPGRRSIKRAHEEQLSRRSACSTQDQGVSDFMKSPTTSLEVRTGGVVKSIVSVGGRVLSAAGTVAAVAAPAFIIMDLIEGQWKAAAWALGATAAGIGADLAATSALAGITLGSVAVAGPVGLFVGAVVGLLFAIIPGLFKKVNNPSTSNITEIVQFAFFGDMTHTGNEKCNDNLVSAGQTPNCTAVYGPGALASIFNWDIFDAATFLIMMNGGYAMSIPDIAASFVVKDYSTAKSSANATAVIDCGSSECLPSSDRNLDLHASVQGPLCPPSKGYDCSKPKFSLNRTLITLPIIDQNANDVYNSVNAGECKIVSDPIEGQVLYAAPVSGTNAGGPSVAAFNSTSPPASTNVTSSNEPMIMLSDGTYVPYNFSISGSTTMTSTIDSNLSSLQIDPISGNWNELTPGTTNITGSPVFIACNLTANIPDVLAPDYNVTRSDLYTSSNTSTDGDTASFIAPPAPAPFSLLTPVNSVCLSYSKAPQNLLCLPNGTFPTCYNGAFGYKSNQLDTLTSFQPATLNLAISLVEESDGTDITPDSSFVANQTNNHDSGLAYAMSTATSQKTTMSIDAPDSNVNGTMAPAMCLYSSANYGGDVWCMGLGGTNFTSNLVNKAASVSLTPGTVAWLYPGYYGNPQGEYISTSVADLSSIPYLTSSSFKDAVAAAWIYES